MLGAGLIAFFFAKFRDLPGKGNGAVFAARAAHRDGPVSYTHLADKTTQLLREIGISIQPVFFTF